MVRSDSIWLVDCWFADQIFSGVVGLLEGSMVVDLVDMESCVEDLGGTNRRRDLSGQTLFIAVDVTVTSTCE
jgi:hypothetical protein